MKRFTHIQFFLSVLFVLLSGVVFTLIFSYAVQTIDQRQEDLFELELKYTEMEVEMYYHAYFATLDNVSEYIRLFGTDDLLDYLIQIHDLDNDMSSMYFGTVDNVMYNSSGFVPGPGFDLRTRIWYTMAVQKGDIISTPAFINATQDKVITTIAKPVFDDNGILLGVIAIDLDIANISAYVSDKKIGNTGYAVLFDASNNVIAHPNLHGDVFISDLTYYGIDLANKEENIVYRYQIVNGHMGALMFTDVINDDYNLLVFMPTEEFLMTHNQFRNYFLLVIVIVIIVAATYMLMSLKYIYQPMNRLLSDLNLVNVKDYIAYRLPVDQHDSFIELRQKLNQDLEETENYFKEALESANELYLENQRFKLLIDSTQDFILQIDNTHRIIFASGKGLSKIKQTSESLVGQKTDVLWHDEKFGHEEIIDLVLKGKHTMYNWDMVINHERFIFETSVSPIYHKDQSIIGAVLISRDITQATKKQEEITYINQHDYLTQLYNRPMFIETYELYLKEDAFPITLMMIDVNGLKIFNDAFGHERGDEVITSVADVLHEVFRDHFVARIGGDEFAVLLKKLDKKEIEDLRHQARHNVSQLKVNQLQLSISIGYTMVESKDVSLTDAMKEAENQMYRFKITESMSVRNVAIQAIHKTLTDKYKEERIHSEKVSQMCYVTGLALGINDERLEELKLAGMYHDIGKIAIPDAILDKPGPLTKEEFDIMKTHTEIGYNILRAADNYSRLAEYALTHHERWDGLGYPRGLKGEEIPLISRIINLCDSYDAMTTNRVYRTKRTKDEAVKEIIKHAGKQFDPELAKIFVTKVLMRAWDES